MLVARADWSALFIETRLQICRCVLDGAAERGKGALLTWRKMEGDRSEGPVTGAVDRGVSTGAGREARRCKEKAG